MVRTESYVPVTNHFGLDVAMFERYFGYQVKGDKEPDSGTRSADILLDDIDNIRLAHASTECESTERALSATGDCDPIFLSNDSVATSQLCETTVQLCEAIDRSSVQELEDFNLLCLKDMSAAIGSRLGAEFTVDCVLPRNKSSAKKNNGVDLRSRVLWSFVESWSLQAVGGMKAVAAAVGLNKDALGR